jgi:hypothetical protein
MPEVCEPLVYDPHVLGVGDHAVQVLGVAAGFKRRQHPGVRSVEIVEAVEIEAEEAAELSQGRNIRSAEQRCRAAFSGSATLWCRRPERLAALTAHQ